MRHIAPTYVHAIAEVAAVHSRSHHFCNTFIIVSPDCRHANKGVISSLHQGEFLFSVFHLHILLCEPLIMITCSSHQGLMLITALEERMPDGLVWQCLLERGMTANKLLKEWKTKSYFLAGKAELLRKEYDSSIAFLESGLKFLNDDPQYLEKITKLKELLSTATKKRAEELKKEKSTWSKAFQKNKAELDKVEIESAAAAENARSEVGKVDEKDEKTIEDILKSMNVKAASHTNATTAAPSNTNTRVGGAAESGSKAAVPRGAQSEEEEEEGEGEGGGLSDETFGWMIGATTVIGVLGVAAFFILKSRQR